MCLSYGGAAARQVTVGDSANTTKLSKATFNASLDVSAARISFPADHTLSPGVSMGKRFREAGELILQCHMSTMHAFQYPLMGPPYASFVGVPLKLLFQLRKGG